MLVVHVKIGVGVRINLAIGLISEAPVLAYGAALLFGRGRESLLTDGPRITDVLDAAPILCSTLIPKCTKQKGDRVTGVTRFWS